MEYLDRQQLCNKINQLASTDVPFLFLIDFKGEKGIVAELSELAHNGIYCCFDGEEFGKKSSSTAQPQPIHSAPVAFTTYQEAFNKVMTHIRLGDSYLLNLTYPTPLIGSPNMNHIYHHAKARYKFMIEEQFMFYSPEPFLHIANNKVSSFPMKGTIIGTDTEAQQQLLSNKKELYEHYTIVDLIRNDLAMISTGIEVEKFRYTETIGTPHGPILQTSSKITGHLAPDWHHRLGTLLLTLLPAGSISGAPKERCVQIIEEVEPTKRGFYTGITGIYRNRTVNSCVNIRFIEQLTPHQYFYRSGGGITALSNAKEEYEELLTKIYVPTI